MSFRLLPKSVTLNDLERRNSLNGTVISPNSVAFGADYLKVIEDGLWPRPVDRALNSYKTIRQMAAAAE